MRMHVPLATLGTLLDLPAGVTVTGVDGSHGDTVLYLDGVPGIDADTVSAQYSVDAKGHRSFLGFVAPEAPAETPAPADEPTELPPETVGGTEAPAPEKPARRRGGSD